MTALPKVAHKRPCNECPFRRTSAAGWLGGDSAKSWADTIRQTDTPICCHMQIAKGRRVYCAGYMIHLRNSAKIPRDAQHAADRSKYAADVETVFQWPHEFEEHHSKGVLAS